MNRVNTLRHIFISFLCLVWLSACSIDSFFSHEAAVGGAAGAVVGSIVGLAIGASVGEIALNTAVNGAIGLGAGVLVGAMYYEYASRYQKSIVVRQVEEINQAQVDIEAMRHEVNDSTKLGQAETKSWNDRYILVYPNEPFEPAIGSFAY